MTIQATSAAKALESTEGEITSHQLISLLMAGGLERVNQAKSSLSEGNKDDADILVNKLIGIINGLRSSLNFEQGGDIAVNLDTLYDYMLNRMDDGEDQRLSAVNEVGDLLTEVKTGWDEMDIKVPEIAAR